VDRALHGGRARKPRDPRERRCPPGRRDEDPSPSYAWSHPWEPVLPGRRSPRGSDTLFLQGCGRTDLPGSDPAAMYDSLVNRLSKLPDDTVVYPGHLYSPDGSASLAETKRKNHVLAPRSARSGSLCSAGRCLLERSQATSPGRPPIRDDGKGRHLPRLHPSRKVEGGQTLFDQSLRCCLRTDTGSAHHDELAVSGQLVQPLGNLAERDVDRFGGRAQGSTPPVRARRSVRHLGRAARRRLRGRSVSTVCEWSMNLALYCGTGSPWRGQSWPIVASASAVRSCGWAKSKTEQAKPATPGQLPS